MNNEDVIIQKLEGPFKSHLYIGFSPANWDAVRDLRRRLEKRGVICSLREMEGSIKPSIQDGVGTSQKCLLFLTPDYMKDTWYIIETNAVVEKSQRLSRDVVIILKSEYQEVIPECLREFTSKDFEPEKFNDEKYLAHFVYLITREPNVMLAVLPKQNIGYGSACGYFYGFLRLVLPGFKKRLIENTLNNDPDLVSKTVQKMLIIMPESCLCAIDLQSPGQIEFTGEFVVCFANRAGNQKRDYKSSLYKLIDNERNQDYYFVGELATPLLTMYETYYFKQCGMTMDQLYAERDGFYYTLKAILSHPENVNCDDQFKLLYWSDPETKKPNQLDLYNFLLPHLRDEIVLQQQNDRNPSKMGTTANVDLISPNLPVLNTSEILTVKGSNPARVYDKIEPYPMDRNPRGLCMIVNNAHFHKGHLKTRKGAEQDTELLKKLFEYLHFKVEVHNDLDAQTLESLFLTTHCVDHSNYDAFVCCIMTHGKLGVIYTSDGKQVEILNLVDFFTDRNCPSLKGKPKMFFIQACQKGDPEPENKTAGNCPPYDGSTATGDHVTHPSFLNAASEHEADASSAPTVWVHDNILSTTRRHKAVLVPGSADFLMSYSTLPGSLSYRHVQTGSFYIQELDKCLRKGEEIDRALKLVSDGIRKRLGEFFQIPFHLTSGMDRLVYL